MQPKFILSFLLVVVLTGCLSQRDEGADDDKGSAAPTDVAVGRAQGLVSTLCGNMAGLQANAPSPMQGGCPTHASQSSLYGPVANAKNWERDFFADVRSAAAVAADGTLYIGTDDHKLYALNPTTGATLWSLDLWSEIRSTPAIAADGTIYFGSNANKIHAVNPTTHAERYTGFDTFGDVTASPAIGADGTVYVGSQTGKFYALNKNLSKKWEFSTGGAIRSSAAIGPDGTIYFGSDDNHLYALNPDKTQKWAPKDVLFANIVSSPAVANGAVYVGSNQNKLHAFNAQTGAVLWERNLGISSVVSSPAVDQNGVIYIGGGDSKLHAFRPDGTELWAFATGGPIASSPVIDRAGNIYFGSDDDNLYAVDASGTQIWKYPTWNNVRGTPVIGANGAVVVGSDDNKLYSVGVAGPAPKAAGIACTLDTDCQVDLVCGDDNGIRFGGATNSRVCWKPSCQNGVKDVGEEKVDCGGACGSCEQACQEACKPGEQVQPPALATLGFASGTFIRGSLATFTRPNGALVRAAGHQLRYVGRSNGKRMALFEGMRTNFVLYSEVLDHGPQWFVPTGLGSILSQLQPDATVAPDGKLSADRLTAPSGSIPAALQLVGNPAGAGSLSAYLKNADPTPGKTRLILTDPAFIGLYSAPTAWALPDAWKRFDKPSTPSIIPLWLGASHLQNWPAGPWDFIPSLPSANYYVWGFQWEGGSFPSSYLPTNDQARKRNADVLTFSPGQVPSWMRTGTWQFDVAPQHASSEIADGESFVLFSFGSDADVVALTKEGGVSRLQIVTGGELRFDAALSWERDQLLTVTILPAAGTVDVQGASLGVQNVHVPFGFPVAPLRIGGVFGGQDEAFAAMTEPRSVSAATVACVTDANFCTAACPCDAGQAGCTADTQCGVGLACIPAAGERVGFPNTYGVCFDPKCTAPKASECGLVDSECGVCPQAATCASDADCREGTTCGAGNGWRFGMSGNVCWSKTCDDGETRDESCGNHNSTCGLCTPPINQAPVCTPSCEGRSCGSDGCSGTCGSGPCLAFAIGWDLDADHPVPDDAVTKPIGPVPIATSVGPNGSGSAVLPLLVAPGRQKIAPAVSLSYNSEGGYGAVGVGWTLDGLSQIVHCAHSIPAGPTSGIRTRWGYCTGGSRLVLLEEHANVSLAEWTAPASDTRVEVYHTETDSFVRYDRFIDTVGSRDDIWVANFKDGRRAVYRTPWAFASKPRSPSIGRNSPFWSIASLSDVDGNSMEFRYDVLQGEHPFYPGGHPRLAVAHPGGVTVGGPWQTNRVYLEILPSRIVYTAHPSWHATRSVRFEFQEIVPPGSVEFGGTPSVDFVSAPGPQDEEFVLLRVSKRLIKVVQTVEGEAAHEYLMGYERSPSSGRDRLKSVTECAVDGMTSVCKPDLTLGWSEQGSPQHQSSYEVPFNIPQDQDIRPVQTPIDIDGDGISEMLWVSHGNVAVKMPRAAGDNSTTTRTIHIARGLPDNAELVDTGVELGRGGYQLTDVDGDGRTDVVIRGMATENGTNVVKFFYSPAEIDTTSSSPYKYTYKRYLPLFGPTILPGPTAGFTSRNLQFEDLNGDGHQDVFICANLDVARRHGTYQFMLWNRDEPNGQFYGAIQDSGFGCADRAGSWDPYVFGTFVYTNPVGSSAPLFVDVDGDGVVELIWYGGTTDNDNTKPDGIYKLDTVTNTYALWKSASLWKDPLHPNPAKTMFSTADVNGDGLADLLSVAWTDENPLATGDLTIMDTIKVHVNTGAGFLEPTELLDGGVAISVHWFPSVRAVDWNSDGRAELILMDPQQGWRMYGAAPQGGRFVDTNVALPLWFTGPSSWANAAVQFGAPPLILYAPVVAKFSRGTGHDILFNANNNETQLWVRPQGNQDLLTEVNQGVQAGKAITQKFVYGDTSNPAVYAWWDNLTPERSSLADHCEDPKVGPWPMACMHGSRTVVVETVTATGSTERNHTRTRYFYGNGRQHEQGRGFLGFTAVWETNNAQKHEATTWYNHQLMPGTSYPLTGPRFGHRWSGYGDPVDEEHEVLVNTLGATLRSCVGAACGAWPAFVYSPYNASTVKQISGPNTVFRSSKTEEALDAWGNMLQSAAFIGPSLADPDYLQRDAEIASYYPPALAWVAGQAAPRHDVGRVKDIDISSCFAVEGPCSVVSDCDPLTGVCSSRCMAPKSCVSRKTKHEYRADGHLWKTALIDTTNAVTPETSHAEFGYDQYGHVVSTTISGVTIAGRSPTTRAASIAYAGVGERDFFFPRKYTNALAQVSHVAHHPIFGTEVAREFGGSVAFTVLDGFGEVRRIQEPTREQTFAQEVGVDFPKLIKTATGESDEVEIFDDLGRPADLERAESENRTSVVERRYNPRGLLESVSVPYAKGQRPNLPPAQRFTYDGAGRLATVSDLDGTVETTTHRSTGVDVTNGRGETKSFEIQNGLLKAIIEPAVEGTRTRTEYAFGAFGKLRLVKDFGGREHRYLHDSFGRVIRQDDPGVGPQTYSFSGFGELLEVAGGSVDTTSMTYDALGRVTSRTNAGVTSQYQWDDAVNGLGRLHWSERGGVRKTYSYDPSGRADETIYAVGDLVSHVEKVTSWDSNSRPKRVTLPKGPNGGSLELEYGYDPRTGAVNSVDRIMETGTKSVWKRNRNTIRGALEEEQFGNNVVTTWAFSGNTDRIGGITTGPGGAIQAYTLGYDGAGNINSRIDRNESTPTEPWEEKLVHDAMNRLASQEVVQGANSFRKLSYGYDSFGNIVSKTETHSGTTTVLELRRADATNPYAITSVPGRYQAAELEYDVRGRLKRKGSVNVEYTSFDRPLRIWNSTGSPAETVYAYDADGQLARTAQGGTTTYFAGSLEKEVGTTGSTYRYHVSNGEKIVATLVWRSGKDVNEAHYLHLDERGSVDRVSDAAGLVYAEQSFGPWGDPRTPEWLDDTQPSTDSLGFAGHRQRQFAGFGLVGAGARLYDPELMGYWQRDPIVGDFADAQDLNPHAYARNKPTVMVDPSGLDEEYTATARAQGPRPPMSGDIASGRWVNGVVYFTFTTKDGRTVKARGYPEYLENANGKPQGGTPGLSGGKMPAAQGVFIGCGFPPRERDNVDTSFMAGVVAGGFMSTSLVLDKAPPQMQVPVHPLVVAAAALVGLLVQPVARTGDPIPTVYIQNNFANDFGKSLELYMFVGAWNAMIEMQPSKSFTTQPVTDAMRVLANKHADLVEAASPKGMFAGKVRGHLPDMTWGGAPTGIIVPQSKSVNSSIGAQRRHNYPDGYTYRRVLVAPNTGTVYSVFGPLLNLLR